MTSLPRTKASSESTRIDTWNPSIGSGRPALYLAPERSHESSIFEVSNSSSLVPFFFFRKRVEPVLSLKEIGDGFGPKDMVRPWAVWVLVHVAVIRRCF